MAQNRLSLSNPLMLSHSVQLPMERRRLEGGIVRSAFLKEGLRKLCCNVRIVKKQHLLIPEIDLVAPLMAPKAFLIRALIDRMPPGRLLILRSSDIEMPWEIEHICNRLGHEVMDVEKEGQTFFFTIRTRGDDRLPVQDPSQLVLTPQKPIRTIDITQNRQPDELENRSPSSLVSLLCRKQSFSEEECDMERALPGSRLHGLLPKSYSSKR